MIGSDWEIDHWEIEEGTAALPIEIDDEEPAADPIEIDDEEEEPVGPVDVPYAEVLWDEEHPHVLGHYSYNAHLLDLDNEQRLQNADQVVDDLYLQSLPMFRLRAGAEFCCGVCQEETREHQLIRRLPCNHCFHVGCGDRWLLRSRATCPLCRQAVTADE